VIVMRRHVEREDSEVFDWPVAETRAEGRRSVRTLVQGGGREGRKIEKTGGLRRANQTFSGSGNSDYSIDVASSPIDIRMKI